jgi:hypothetical protein
MERLGEVVAMEDDLSLAKRPAARDGEDSANVLGRQALEQGPLHVGKCLSPARHSQRRSRERRLGAVRVASVA